MLEYQANIVTQLKEPSRFLFIYLVYYKLDICCIQSLVCKRINSIPSQTNMQLCFYDMEMVVITCQTTQLNLIDTELSVFYMYLLNNPTRYISVDNVQQMINYLSQPDRHRTEETNYSTDEKYELTKQRDHLRMIRELMITDKDMRGKQR